MIILVMLAGLMTALLGARPASAQMFSVAPEREIVTEPQSVLRFGARQTSFNFRGPDQLVGTNRDLTFNGTTFSTSLELDGFFAYADIGRNLSDDNTRYTAIGARIRSSLPLTRNPAFQVSIPIMAGTDYVVARSDLITIGNQEFKQNTAGIYSGLDVRARLNHRVRFNLDGSVGYSFSATGYGVSGGTTTDWIIRNHLFVDELVRRFGLSIGFEIGSRRYFLEDRAFNYKVTQQALTFGITF